MASGSTAFFQAVQYNSLPQFMFKQTPDATYDESFADKKGPLQKLRECYMNELRTVAKKDRKLGEFVAVLETQNRPSRETSPQPIVKRIRLEVSDEDDTTDSEEVDTTDSEDSENDEVMHDITERELVLVKIEFRSFIHKVWLRRIGLSRGKGDTSYDSSLHDLELTIHNAQENIKRCKSIVKEIYNEDELQQRIHENTDSLEEALNKVLEKKEISGFEMTDEDILLFQRPTVLLCASLGLKLDFLDRLDTFPDDHFYHRSLCDWIDIFLQNNSKSVSLEKKTLLTLDLLDSIGFDPLSTAVDTIMARSSKGNIQCHIEPSEWARIFIQDEFNYNPLLSSRVDKFPFQSDLTNSWFQLPNTNYEESESSLDPCHVNIVNFVTTESNALKDIRSKLDGFLPQRDWATVLYHGTDHHSAVDILFRGIDLRTGRQNRDFSCGSGFYLTKNLDEAVNWASTTTAKPAILVFQVNHEENLNNAKRLDLNNEVEKWYEIVTSFRSGRRTAKTWKSVSAYDLIEGPQATLRYDEASPELLWKPKPSSYQMCLISDDFAETFEKTLHSIIFLEVS
ncbi:hypothetical protein P5673_012719 [Acropora cervicornis]|uniref:PARP catalytic domain-containing protein n=1 Tax=Acropora cervicornis TaxID=6130 RepID=A0AAD9V738_ACRCE|nr:hypothetical protein P5673_012719 [Acropora cervicornis]